MVLNKCFAVLHLKECTAFFQYPKRQWSPSNRIWYENRPLGIQRSGTMMKEISEAAGLSKKCTNYSVRATAITLWSNARLSNRHMAIFGHRNEQSLRSYNARLPSGSYNTAAMCCPTHFARLQSHLHQFRSSHKPHRPRYYSRVPSRFTEMPPSPSCFCRGSRVEGNISRVEGRSDIWWWRVNYLLNHEKKIIG